MASIQITPTFIYKKQQAMRVGLLISMLEWLDPQNLRGRGSCIRVLDKVLTGTQFSE